VPAKGVLAEFTINTEGPPSQTLEVTCTVYDAANGERVPKAAGVTPKRSGAGPHPRQLSLARRL